MSRLVAFGCSYTYGYGLPDCFIPPNSPGTDPSIYSWASIVAKGLKLSCDNKSRPGASNFEILEKILSYEYEPDDTVIVMWSFHEREMLYTDNLERVYLHTGSTQDVQSKWLSIHTDTDFRMRTWIYTYTAHLHLESLNVKFHFLNVDFDKLFHDLKPKWAEKVKFLKPNLHFLGKCYTLGLDNKHPGIIPHAIVAKNILKELEEK